MLVYYEQLEISLTDKGRNSDALNRRSFVACIIYGLEFCSKKKKIFFFSNFLLPYCFLFFLPVAKISMKNWVVHLKLIFHTFYCFKTEVKETKNFLLLFCCLLRQSRNKKRCGTTEWHVVFNVFCEKSRQLLFYP